MFREFSLLFLLHLQGFQRLVLLQIFSRFLLTKELFIVFKTFPESFMNICPSPIFILLYTQYINYLSNCWSPLKNTFNIVSHNPFSAFNRFSRYNAATFRQVCVYLYRLFHFGKNLSTVFFYFIFM